MPYDEVYVERDYTHGTLTQFNANSYPYSQLQGKITEEEFKTFIGRVNALFKQAETYNCWTCLEAFMGCASFFTLYLCYENRYEKMLKRLDVLIQQENTRIRDKGVEWLNPVKNGLLHLIILVHT
eukprot:TRINITY_DN3319_c0_g1_i1.p1 TRINITY_DN3319_c0_g1~~TRINITY_DN3319_c0_g1_i1.p1  ORF type:complete len:125 (+),score=8.25 TRINITY_DN3319_c0_g1_i1:461-835(+)